nr:hypothetical protein [Entomoplasma sp. MP1]
MPRREAPVPVPPPHSCWQKKIKSAPSKAALSSFFTVLKQQFTNFKEGFAPAPKPFVDFSPKNGILFETFEHC